MIRTLVLRALFVLALAGGLSGCATSSHVDPPWSAEDEAALARFRTEAAAAAATQPAADIADPPAILAMPTGPLLEIYVFNLGQADSMLVVGPRPQRKTLLVDLGQRNGGDPPPVSNSAAHVRQRILTIIRRGGATAQQLATESVTNPTTFRNANGRIADEIQIVVERDGRTYTIEGMQQTATAR